MVFLALGMACVAFGASDIVPGAKTASVSMIWLILVYLFHTMGELCISPVGLSYVSKLVPARMIAIMYGIWYLAVAIGMKGAAKFGENVDKIADEKGISYFFWILTIVSIVVAVLAVVFAPFIRKENAWGEVGELVHFLPKVNERRFFPPDLCPEFLKTEQWHQH